MILLVCAVATELRFLDVRAGLELLVTGLGPVEAAIATAARLARGGVDLVVNAGIGGVFAGRGAVGDAFSIAEDHYVELAIEGSDGTLGGGRFTLQRAAYSEPALVHGLTAGGQFPAGRGITVANMTVDDAVARAHAAREDCDVESMEGFAVLRAANVAGVPALELRGISNVVGARESGGWDIDAGIGALARIVPACLELARAR